MADFDLATLKRKMLRKYPAFGAEINDVNYKVFENGKEVSTACTDGKTIYINQGFMEKMSEEEQVFILAHEVSHIALNHIMRCKDKDMKLWNIATDAVINQYLKQDGLPMPEGAIDFENANHFDAEEVYEKLLEEKQKKEEQSKQQQQNGQEQQSGQEQNEQSQNQQTSSEESENGNSQQENKEENSQEQDEDMQMGHDDHSMWKKAVEEAEKEKEKHSKEKGESQEKKDEPEEKIVSEKDFFKKNEEEKVRIAEEIMKNLSSERRGNGGETQLVEFSDIGDAGKPVVNWKRMLIRNLELEDEAWGHKFSDKSNNYASRIEDVEYDEKAETEIILDTSGSVSVNLLKNFLRQVKTILKNSTIKVGTFSDDFYGWTEIKREADIDSLRLYVGGGTNFDAASRAFSKRKDVNKICFTDGQDGGNAEIREPRKDITWISFENPNFKPDNGKVMFVPENLINMEMEKSDGNVK